ncbi:MAG TPA: M50 family metallopeptidase [Candidatus Paceibacterota bacterium]|jgi:regulator of sigma E protease|nr:M50 family metallopeptidase [Candidatus Paceibacterota bacterium]
MVVILFILVILVTVLVHEWGHFFVARKSGMIVEEFGFGIPPRIYSWKKGETEYSINALPIGGFVKIAGENGLETTIPLNKQFETKPWYLKSAVLVAGVICNLLLAVILFTAAYSIGIPVTSDHGAPTVVSVVPGSATAKSTLGVGDVITSVVASNATLTGEITTESLHEIVMNSKGPIIISYNHLGKSQSTTITPTGEGMARVIGMAVEPVQSERLPIFTAFKAALEQTWSTMGEIFSTLALLIAGLFHHNNTGGSLVGPVGLAQEIGSAASIGFTYLLAFTAAISVNLAVINILPFPALDGGRLVVVLLEAIFRRKFSSNTVAIIHSIGFLLLLLLMVVLTVGDIRRLI